MKFCRFFVAFCLACSFLIPDRVYADSTYFQVTANTCYTDWYYNSYGKIYYEFDTDVRIIRIQMRNSTQSVVYAISLSSFHVGESTYSNNPSCPVPNSSSSFHSSSNNFPYNFYWKTLMSGIPENNSYNVPFTIISPDYIDSTSELYYAYYYTFGDGTIEPTPTPPAYGNLIDVKFSTSIAGNGSAAINNIDHITWNPEMDSNGNTFDGTERVQIKAIAGNYTESSRNGLLGLGVTDFDYNSGAEHMLAEYPATRGYYDVSWSHVIQQLNAGSISDFLNIRKNDDVWLKSGWIYQIRLVAGEYESQWITIYNGTSSGVENSLTIENSTELNMTLINTIQQINNLNQNVTNWEIDNTTINMENQDGTETTNKPWWAYLLEALVSLLNGILGFLGNLIGDLIDAIVSLFQPDEFTINNFNEYKLELKQNSGIFGQAIDFTNTLKNTFLGVQYQEPIIHWSGISFGETELIPAADYNLNDYVTMWGLGDFRTMAYLCSDGFIYFSLLILIVRKLNEVLKK